MPFKSQAQRRKFAELLVKGKISNETFEEWNRETGRKKLPERVKPKRKTARETKTSMMLRPSDRRALELRCRCAGATGDRTHRTVDSDGAAQIADAIADPAARTDDWHGLRSGASTVVSRPKRSSSRSSTVPVESVTVTLTV